jgi:hypothetical protein
MALATPLTPPNFARENYIEPKARSPATPSTRVNLAVPSATPDGARDDTGTNAGRLVRVTGHARQPDLLGQPPHALPRLARHGRASIP